MQPGWGEVVGEFMFSDFFENDEQAKEVYNFYKQTTEK